MQFPRHAGWRSNVGDYRQVGVSARAAGSPIAKYPSWDEVDVAGDGEQPLTRRDAKRRVQLSAHMRRRAHSACRDDLP